MKFQNLYFLVVLLLCVCKSYEQLVSQVWLTTLNESILFEQQNDVEFVDQGDLEEVDVKILVDDSIIYQRVYGFGGALTQSSAYLFSQLLEMNETFGREVLESFFSNKGNGIGINMIRVPASSCDFSLVNYTYDDVPNDIGLVNLSISIDKEYTIPILKEILAINPNVKLIYSPWTAPSWMKSSNNYNYGELLEDYYDTYTDFFVKFLSLYKEEEGIEIYAITLQNEPLFQPMTYPGMLVESSVEKELVKLLGPKLEAANLTTKIFIYDHNWVAADYPIDILQDEVAYQYVGATAFHCYQGDVTNQSLVYNQFPDKEIHLTECSGGYWAPDFSSDLVWATNNLYIGSIENWSSSVLQWNLALNKQDGPTNNGCLNCRGFITVNNPEYNSIIYNVEYYGTAHYNKFISTNSYRIQSNFTYFSNSTYSTCLNQISFQNNPDNSNHIVILNSCSKELSVQIQVLNQYLYYTLQIGLTTLYWSN